MKPQSKRFTPSKWAERLVPVLLVILSVGLVAALALVVLSVMGVLHF